MRVFEEFSWVPPVVMLIAFPFDLIFQASTVAPRSEDMLYEPFVVFTDACRRWLRVALSRKGVVRILPQKADVERIMTVHTWRQLELVGVLG